MSTHNANNSNYDSNPRNDTLLSTSIQLNAKNVLHWTGNSNNESGVTDICETNENYHTKQRFEATVTPLNASYKNNPDSGDLAQTNGKNVAAETFIEGLIQETRVIQLEPNNNILIQSTVSVCLPGAHAVEGIGGNNLNQPLFSSEHMIYSSIGIDDEKPTLLTATLVSEESLPEQMLMETTIPAFSAVPMEDPQKSRRRRQNFLIAVAALFSGIGGAIVAAISSQQRNKGAVINTTPTATLSLSLTPSEAPTYTPSSQPSNMLEGLFTVVALDLNTGLPAKNTSQYKALNWLLEQNAVLEFSAEELRQRFALATLIFSSKGSPVTDVLSADSHCTWPGITCGMQEGSNDMQVIGIDTNFSTTAVSNVKERSVTLLPELALLSNSITFLKFPVNTVRGTIPTELGLLTALNELVIGDRYGLFDHGELPSQFGQLSKLTHLSLQGCGLIKALPTQIGRLTALLHLDLGINYLTSSVPTEIGQLTLLQYFNIARNKFINDFPYQVGSLKNLEYFSITDNSLVTKDSGYLPLELTNLTKLKYLSAASNNIVGFRGSFCCIESYFSGLPDRNNILTTYLGRLTLLTTLELFDNNILFSLPTEIGNLVNLQHLALSENSLSGTIPTEIGLLTKLTHVNLRSNQLQGMLPSILGLLTNLEYADFSENQLSGEPPKDLSNLTSLSGWNMQLNSIAGVINCSLFGNMLSSIYVDCAEVYCIGNCYCVSQVTSAAGPMETFCPTLGENTTGF